MDSDSLFYFASDKPVSVIMAFVEDNRLIPNTDYYEFPWMGEVEQTFSSLYDLVEFLEGQSCQEYPLYFKDDQGDHYFAGVMGDGRLVFGIPYFQKTPDDLAKIARKYGGFYGYIGAGMPEIGSIEQFKLDPKYNPPKAIEDEHIVIYGDPNDFG